MAIRIQLPTGKTVMVANILDALEFDFQEAIANNSGYEISNPFSETMESDEVIYEETYLRLEIPEISEIIEIEELDIEED
jgi:hypothetical protein